ncbi:MAG: class I tRNA ligase family protein, partial [Actinobacteria bacterium]|nr:class I tRNA ligase family protein [Actinomycetota bacterium]
ISFLMELVNEFEDYLQTEEINPDLAYEVVEKLCLMIAPIAPHLAEEIWHMLGKEGSVHQENWPEPESKLLVSKEAIVVIQINGKVKEKVKVPVGSSKDDVLNLALSSEKVSKTIAGREIKKVIYVQDKILNIVV